MAADRQVVLRRAALATLLVLALLAPVGLAAAADTPAPACGTCGRQFGEDVGVNVTRSVVDVRLRENGSTRWTARTTLTDESARTLRNRSGWRRDVREEADYSRLGRPENVSVRLDGDTVVTSYRLADFQTRSFGVLLLNGLERAQLTHVNAERLTIHPPAGYEAVRVPEGQTAENGSLVWHGSSHEKTYDNPTIGSEYAAFAPAGTGHTSARVALAVAAVETPKALSQLRALAWFFVPLSLVALGVYALGSRFFTGDRDPRRVGDAVAVYALAVGVVGAVYALSKGPHALAPAAVLTGLGVAVTTTLAGRGLTTPGRALAAGVASASATAALAAAAVAGSRAALSVATTFVPLAALPLAFYALGRATGRGDRRRRWVDRAVIVLLPLAAPLPALPFGGFGGFALLFAVGGWLVATVFLAVPVYYAGYVHGVTAGDGPVGAETS